MKLKNNYWVDENNNKWCAEYYSEEENEKIYIKNDKKLSKIYGK